MQRQPIVIPALNENGPVINVSGALSFDTVLVVLDAGVKLINDKKQPIFDFSKVTKTDSAAVALLLEWWRAATLTNKSIQFINLPQSMLSLIKVASLETVLAGCITL